MVLKSAEGRNAKAQNYVGKFYHNGIGTDKDNDKAIYWYKKKLHIMESKEAKKIIFYQIFKINTLKIILRVFCVIYGKLS